MVQNRIIKTELIEWRKIKALQPDNAKVIFNYKDIEASILRYGFAQPFYVWEKDGELYAIDGHTRIEVLSNMGNVPEQLPATFINAESRKEAVEILLEVYNQKHNPFDIQVLEEYIEAEQVDVNLESINVKIEQNISDSEDFGTDFTLPDGDKAPFQQMTFTLADEQAEQIKNAIADIKETEEYKYAETMGNENSNGNALYLIVMQWAEQRK